MVPEASGNFAVPITIVYIVDVGGIRIKGSTMIVDARLPLELAG